MNYRLLLIVAATLSVSTGSGLADTFPPLWGTGTIDEISGPVHFAPVAWPGEPADPADCGFACGDWKAYTRFQSGITDPRTQDPSNGGTRPQNYVNVASSCIDKAFPSVYYNLYRHPSDPSQDVIMFRWRVEQIANTYATGPSAGSYRATSPWGAALWTVLFDVDGDGFRDLAAHLNGSSGSPAESVDMIAGIWGNIPTQSIDYNDDPNVNLIAHNPTAFVGPTDKLLNFAGDPANPTESWPNSANEAVWDYGTTRAKLVYTNSCTEYFIDYQIPVRMLDASSTGPNSSLEGPKITRDTPISMLFCTANSLNNPFQKDCSLNRSYLGDASKPGPFGDYLSFNKQESYRQPIVSSVTGTGPGTCPGTYRLNAEVQDTLYVDGNGAIRPSVQSVEFYYWYDKDGDGTTAGDGGSVWTHAVDGSLSPGTLNAWSASWDATSLLKGKYLIGVQAVDDKTLHDDGVPDAPMDNRTFSYLPGSTATDTQAQIYSNDWRFDGNTKSWIQGTSIGWVGTGADDQQAAFPSHSPSITRGNGEDWYGNPDVTGTQTALIGVAINTCGVAPTISKTVSASNLTVGQDVTFTLTVSNPANNPNPVSLTQLQDVLPTGFTYKPSSTTGVFGTVDPSVSGQTLTWTGSTSIAPGLTADVDFVATAPSVTGAYSNVGTATTDFGDIVSEPLQIGVGAPRLTIGKTPSTYSAAPGGTITYTITYANDSPVNATGVTLTDALPAGVTYVADSCTGGCTYTAGTRTLDWGLGNLAAGEGPYTVSFQATVDSPYSGSAVNQNTATIDSTETAAADSTASVYIDTPRPSLTLRKTASSTLVAPGTNVVFTLEYANTGTASGTSIVLSDPLPSGYTFVSATGAPTSTPAVGSNGTVTWNLGTLAASGTGSVSVTARASNPFTGIDNPATNAASISSTEVPVPVTDSADVGVSEIGQLCRTYYITSQQGEVGTDGVRYLATTSTPTGGTTTISTLADDTVNSGVIEIARFYQDPVSSQLVTFDGSSTLGGQLDYTKSDSLGGSRTSNSVLYLTVYGYDPSTGATVQIAQSSKIDNGAPTPPVSLTDVVPTGSLSKGHRLLIVMGVDMASNRATTIELQANSPNSFVEICASPPANLVLEKTVDAASVDVTGTGRTLTYTLNYANTSSAMAATNASIIDTLPSAGVTYVSCSVSGSADFDQCTESGGTVTFTSGAGATIPAGGSGSVTVTVNVADDLSGIMVLTNSAQIESDQTALAPSGGTTATTTVSGAISNPSGTPNVLIDKQASKTLLIPGDTVTYTLAVVNAGDKTATDVQVSDAIPAETYFSYLAGSISGGNARSDASSPLTWTIDSLAPGASSTLSLQMAVANDGSAPSGVTTLDNTASATYSGGGSGTATSDTVTLSVSTNANLSIAKTAAPSGTLSPGDTLTYTLVVTNNGSGGASGVVVSDPIPANTSFTGSITASVGAGSFDAVNNRIMFDVGTLAPSAAATLSFQVKLNRTLDDGSTELTNTGTVSAANASTRTDTANSTASAAPLMTLNKSGLADIAYPAATLTAAADASTTLFVDGTAAFEVGQYLKVGATVTRITGLSGTSLTVDTGITANTGDPVIAAATYSLTFRNTGDADASNVVLSDTLPAGPPGLGFHISLPAADSDPGAGNSGAVIWNLGLLAAGASGSVQVTAFPTGPGTITNAAAIESDETALVTDTVDTRFGGLTVTKQTSTPTSVAGGIATYTIILRNSKAFAINAVEVKDLLPSGFTYRTGTTEIDGAGAADPLGDAGQPVWSVDVPAGGSVSLAFQADIAATVGAATYQNGVELTKSGVGIAPFDPLITTAEDVTVLASGTGMAAGTVYRDNDGNGDFDPTVDTPLANAAVTLIDDTGTVYVVYTDAAGYFSRVVSTGATVVDVDNGTLPSGLVLTSGADGSDPTTVSVPDAGGITKDTGFVPAAGAIGNIDGKVYYDNGTAGGTAGNGIQDGTEAGLLGIQVVLRDAATGAVVATAYTDVLGNYAFPNVPAGNYQIDLVPTTGYYVTTGNDPTAVTVTNGGGATANFGLLEGKSVSGTVFSDDGTGGGTAIDGLQNGGESGTNAGSLNLVIVDSSNTVLAVTPVGASGAWNGTLPAGTGYSAYVTTAEPAVGSTVTRTASLPSGWYTTGENINGTPDGSVDGILSGIDASSDVANLNFGITDAIPDVYTTVTVPASVAAGDLVTTSLTFGNQGTTIAAGVTYSVTLPDGLTGLRCSGATCDYDLATGVLNLSGLPTVLVADQTEQVLVSYTAPASGPLELSSVIATTTSGDPVPANDATTGTTAVSSSVVDVAASLSAPQSAQTGSTVEVPVNFTNLGGVTASGITYTLVLPPGLSGVTCTGSGISCSYDGTTGTLSVTGLPGALDPGQTASLTLSYTAPANGTVEVTAAAAVGGSPGDDDLANNTAAESTSVNTAASTPDVLSTVAPPTSAVAGSTVTVPVSFTSLGPDAATVTLYDVDLSGAAVTNVEIHFKGAMCSHASGTGAITGCGLPDTLSPGKTLDLKLTYTAPASGTVTVASNISVSQAETNTANNPSAGSTTVSTATVPDVYTTVDAPPSVTPGDTVNALVQFGNQGMSTAQAVSYQITLPPGLASVACIDTAYSYDGATGIVTLSGLPDSLNPGQRVQLQLFYNAPTGIGELVVVSDIATGTPGETPNANNSDQAETLMQASNVADPTVWIDAPGAANAGDTVEVRIGYSNLGNADATAVTYAVEFSGSPSNILVSYQGTACSYALSTGAVSGCGLPSTLNPGQMVQLVATYLAPAIGLVEVTSTVSAPNDADSGNNSARDQTALDASVQADVTAAVAPPSSATTGSSVNVPLTFSNQGPNAAAGVSYRTALTGSPTDVVVTYQGATCSYDSGTGTVTGCGLPGTLNTGQSIGLNLSYVAPASGSVTVTGIVATTTPEDDTANNIASGSTTVTGVSPTVDVYAGINAPGTAQGGAAVDLALNFGNQGSGGAGGVTYSLLLPAGVTGVSCTTAGVTCSHDSASGLVTLSGLPTSLNGGQSTTVTLRYKAPAAAGSITATAYVSAAGDSGTGGNNSAQDTTTVHMAPASQPQQIPTLSEWAALLLILLTAVAGAFAVQRGGSPPNA